MKTAPHFTSLPRERYVADSWFEREMDEVISRQWVYFGHVSQMVHTGDVLVRDVAGESIVAVRDGDGAIHAFFNVCRHRGSRICDTGTARLRRFICPYHQWSYELDGSLRSAPSMKEQSDLDFGDYSLHRAHTEIWHGFIFVGLGIEPPERSVEQGFAAATEHVEVFCTEQTKLAHQVQWDVASNWKLLVENFQECYHCRGSHPELCAVQDVGGVYDVGDTFTSDDFFHNVYPLRAPAESFTISGRPACKIPLGRADSSTIPYGVGTAPTLVTIAFFADHVALNQILPVSTTHSRWTTQWFVHPEAAEGRDYDLRELTEIWVTTAEQDIVLCERNQLGVRSRRYVPGPNSVKQEPGIRGTLAAYHRLLGELDRYEELTGSAALS